MFENGRITRFGQTMLLVFSLAVIGISSAIYLKAIERDGQDSTGAILGVLGIVSAIAVAAINLNQNKRNEDILHGQNERLASIDEKANVNPAVDAYKEELKNQRHAFNNVLMFLTNRNTELEGENRQLTLRVAMLEENARKSALIAEKLADRTTTTVTPDVAPPANP
jgi:hypothetical protein